MTVGHQRSVTAPDRSDTIALLLGAHSRRTAEIPCVTLRDDDQWFAPQ
jgi:hypothetical protein